MSMVKKASEKRFKTMEMQSLRVDEYVIVWTVQCHQFESQHRKNTHRMKQLSNTNRKCHYTFNFFLWRRNKRLVIVLRRVCTLVRILIRNFSSSRSIVAI